MYILFKSKIMLLHLITKLIKAFKKELKILHPDEILFIFKFLSRSCKDRVLIVEGNNFHHETLPSYIKYFSDLGYKCDLLLDSRTKKDYVFFNLGENLLGEIHYARMVVIWNLLKFSKFLKYKYIFISSNDIGCKWRIFTNLKNLRQNNVIIVEHDLSNLNENDYKNFKLAMLCDFSRSELKSHIINPHWFGFEPAVSNKNKRCVISVVGRIDYSRLDYEIIEDLIKSDYLSDLNCELRLIGACMDEKFPINAKACNYKHISQITFEQLYAYINETDFLLSSYNKDNFGNTDYGSIKTSGQNQLSLGFLKPLIIQKDFAQKFGFTKKCALFYDDKSDFLNVISDAVNMHNDQYIELQKNLLNYKKELYNVSLKNLSNFIKD